MEILVNVNIAREKFQKQWSRREERERSVAKWIAKVNDTVVLLKASYLKRRINDSVENLARDSCMISCCLFCRVYVSVCVCIICIH